MRITQYHLRMLAMLTFVQSVGQVPALAQQNAAANLAGLAAAYPELLDRVEGNTLVWKDGTRMTIDDGKGPKSFEALLASPDIKDMFFTPYPPGPLTAPPAVDADPGRARNSAFFDKMYGNCRSGAAAKNLVKITWLPKKWGKSLQATRVNGVAEQLSAVSKELDELPTKFDVFLFPTEGTYTGDCRVIAGTNRVSEHGYGIAIDLPTKRADYWRWAGAKAHDPIPYRNKIPMEIVTIFEKHGFIWGGKWYHYDTMHFEYRPELLPTAIRE
jgi:D-alanyl-D-alanine carboxypeptidase